MPSSCCTVHREAETDCCHNAQHLHDFLTPPGCRAASLRHRATEAPPDSLRTAPPQAADKREKKKRKKQVPEEAQPATPSNSSAASDQSNIDTAAAVSPPATAALEPAAETDPLMLEKFALSPGVVKLLNEKGIKSLFPIQVKS